MASEFDPKLDEQLQQLKALSCVDLPRLYALGDTDIDDAIDYLYEQVDDALWAGHPERVWLDVEEFLRQLDVSRISIELMVSVLIITLPLRGRQVRSDVVSTMRTTLLQTEPLDRITQLLVGLS